MNVIEIDVHASLATPTVLEPKGRDRVVQLLNVLLADAFALYMKTKNYHWLAAARSS